MDHNPAYLPLWTIDQQTQPGSYYPEKYGTIEEAMAWKKQYVWQTF